MYVYVNLINTIFTFVKKEYSYNTDLSWHCAV